MQATNEYNLRLKVSIQCLLKWKLQLLHTTDSNFGVYACAISIAAFIPSVVY